MPNSVLVILLAVIFTAVLAIGQGLYWGYVARIEKGQDELRRRLGQNNQDEEDVESIFREDEAAKNQSGFTGQVQTLLTTADAGYTPTTLFARMIIAGGIGLLGGGLGLRSPIGMVLALPFGLAPYFWLKRQAAARTDALIEQIPDALDLMARSLQAGMGLSDSFKLVAEEMPMPIAAEFGRVFEEVRFGRDLRDAFDKLLSRTPGVFDLRLLVSSILLQRETGGNLIEILTNISHTIRRRFVFKAKVRAMTSEAKFTAALLAGLPIVVVLMLWIMNPDYLEPMFTDILGNILLVFAALLFSTGLFLMNEVSKLEV